MTTIGEETVEYKSTWAIVACTTDKKILMRQVLSGTGTHYFDIGENMQICITDGDPVGIEIYEN